MSMRLFKGKLSKVGTKEGEDEKTEMNKEVQGQPPLTAVTRGSSRTTNDMGPSGMRVATCQCLGHVSVMNSST